MTRTRIYPCDEMPSATQNGERALGLAGPRASTGCGSYAMPRGGGKLRRPCVATAVSARAEERAQQIEGGGGGSDCYAGQRLRSCQFGKTAHTPTLKARGAVRAAAKADGQAPTILVAGSARRTYESGRLSCSVFRIFMGYDECLESRDSDGRHARVWSPVLQCVRYINGVR